MTESRDSVERVGNVEQNELSWGCLGIDVYLRISIISALLWSVFHVEVSQIVTKWINDPSWSHGFLIPLFSFYFLNQNRDSILELKTKPSYLGMVLLAFFLAFYPFNLMFVKVGYLEPLTMIAAVFSTVLFLGGWKLIRYTWLPILYLVFAVPLPNGIYVAITMPMRKVAAQIATMLINLLPDITAEVQGVVINVMKDGKVLGQGLNVAEACSGMRLLMAFLALGVAMAYLHWRPVWQRMVLLGSTIPIAVLCNIVRVTATGFIHILWGPKYASGIYHDLLGMLMLPLAFMMYGGLSWFMTNLFTEHTETETEDVVYRSRD